MDRLKIDRSFMAELAGPPAEQTIVAAIVGMARGLGIPVTAEGSRRPSSSSAYALGCDAVQGFLLARPAAPGDTGHLLHQPLGPRPFQLHLAAGDGLRI